MSEDSVYHDTQLDHGLLGVYAEVDYDFHENVNVHAKLGYRWGNSELLVGTFEGIDTSVSQGDLSYLGSAQ